MNTYRKRVLLAVDGSPASLETVRYASAIFPADRTEIVLFHVAANIPETYWEIDKAFRDRTAPVRAWIHETHRTMSAFMGKATQTLTRAGFRPQAVSAKIERQCHSVVDDIIAEAGNGYDGVVVSRRGVSLTKDVLAGKTGNRLMPRLRGMPIIVVSGNPSTQRVMIALDDTTDCSRGVSCVGNLLADTPADITLCHVIKSRMMASTAASHYWDDSHGEISLARDRQRITPLINQAQDRLIQAGVAPERIQVSILENCVSRTMGMLEEARQAGIGTIVTGCRHLSALESWFFGSVSRQMVNWAKGMAIWVAA